MVRSENTTYVKRVLVVAVPPSQELNIIGPLSVFSLANEQLVISAPDAPHYTVELVSAAPELKVNGQPGFSLVASQSYADVRGEVDTLLVAGGEGALKGTTHKYLAWLRDSL